MISESAIVCQVKPENPKIVVLGVDTTVSLSWETCRGDAGEIILGFNFKRQRPWSVETQQIASRGASDGGFTRFDPFKDRKKYDARLSQELKILNVLKDDEYVYTLAIIYRPSGGGFLEEPFRVTLKVKGKLK